MYWPVFRLRFSIKLVYNTQAVTIIDCYLTGQAFNMLVYKQVHKTLECLYNIMYMLSLLLFVYCIADEMCRQNYVQNETYFTKYL